MIALQYIDYKNLQIFVENATIIIKYNIYNMWIIIPFISMNFKTFFLLLRYE